MNIKEMIEIMVAFDNGAEIECFGYNGVWEATQKPVWNWDENDYRIKPTIERRWKWRKHRKRYSEDSKMYVSDKNAREDGWIIEGWIKTDEYIDIDTKDIK